MGITRLYTADIYVHDLDKAVDFYVDKLGFEKRADEPVDEEGHRWVEVAPEWFWDRARPVARLRLLGPRRRSRLVSPDLPRGGHAGTVEALKAEGSRCEGGPEESPYGTYARVRDRDGSVFGLLQEARG